ncbi:Uncharacterized protein TCM_014381 [Theobroma cacao]|uniref:Reverse transcriptase domain-containing protein n=1 Tax=Theobroma cacao TaxID=3641 RepID=A0A061G589_THECC|nr:Uncharacterized protein TCM_014381 [Theobroma cacao]
MTVKWSPSVLDSKRPMSGCSDRSDRALLEFNNLGPNLHIAPIIQIALLLSQLLVPICNSFASSSNSGEFMHTHSRPCKFLSINRYFSHHFLFSQSSTRGLRYIFPPLIKATELRQGSPERREDNDVPCAIPSLHEVQEAIFDIAKNSVVGPDGLSSFFYKHCWSIISKDLLEVVTGFFQGATLPKGMTSTTPVLLPKNSNPLNWSDIRPSSLCTVFNKISTKILANRLSKLLLALISDNQNGFVSQKAHW